MFLRHFAALVSVAVAGQVCRPTPCFDGKCSSEAVTFTSVSLPLMAWDDSESNYTSGGSMSAHSFVHNDFGIFLHGPLFRPAQRQAQDFAPPLLVVGSLVDKIWRLEDIRDEDGSVTAKMKFIAWAAAPSTLYPVPPKTAGSPERFLVAEGNPFLYNPGNHTSSGWLGGVDLVDEEKCTTIFPKGAEALLGKVVNTVECHESGFCFFSVWKFYDDSLPGAGDDCLYWCRVQSVNDPTTCIEYGVMTNEFGGQICHVDGRGAVHGLKIGKTDASNPMRFDLFLLFTGKGTFDKGDSAIFKLKVTAMPQVKGNTVRTESSTAWGTDLWQRSVAKPHDVGVDHAWIDDDGKYVWVGTFRNHNDGVHMLDYDTGRLIHSIWGIATVIPGKYTYTAGLSGTGAWGKKGSVLAIATCEEFGQQFFGGHSAVVLIDISKIPKEGGANRTSTILV